MIAPKEIIYALESILGLLFSDIKHKERATFILCDNMVELCCKTKIKELNPQDKGKWNFYEALNKTGIQDPIKNDMWKRHKLRNSMQHDQLSIHVSFAQCADFIVDIVDIIKVLWGSKALFSLDEWLICSIKISFLYSSQGRDKAALRFESCIFNDIDWRQVENNITISGKDESDELVIIDENKYIKPQNRKRFPNKNELIIAVNKKNKLNILVREFPIVVNDILDELELNYKI